MRFIVVGQSKNYIDQVIEYGAKVGFDMIHATDQITRTLVSGAHAIIYVIDDATNNAEHQLNELVAAMISDNLKRLVISTISTKSHMNTHHLSQTGIEWTEVKEPLSSDEFNLEEYAQFIIYEVTNSDNINRSIVRGNQIAS
jgi:hypothetical protein